MWWAVWTAGVPLIALTLLPLVRSGAWWIRIWDYPRLQLAVLLAATAGAAGGLAAWDGAGPAEWGLIAATLAALGWQVVQIVAYTPLYPVESKPAADGSGRGVRLLIANVLMENRDADRLLAIVADADPDLVLAVETDAWWARALAPLRRDYPHVVAEPRPNTYGMHLFSRLPLRDVEIHHLVRDEIPSVFARVRLASGDWCDLWCLHPEPPQPANDTDERDAELVIVGRRIAGARGPTIVAGDLNDVAWSHTTRLFQRISRLLDPRVGRGMYATYSAKVPVLRWPLDHIFHDDHFRLARLRRLGAFGSDHFPVLVELVYAPGRRHEQEPPAADAADREQAREMVANGRRAAEE